MGCLIHIMGDLSGIHNNIRQFVVDRAPSWWEDADMRKLELMSADEHAFCDMFNSNWSVSDVTQLLGSGYNTLERGGFPMLFACDYFSLAITEEDGEASRSRAPEEEQLRYSEVRRSLTPELTRRLRAFKQAVQHIATVKHATREEFHAAVVAFLPPFPDGIPLLPIRRNYDHVSAVVARLRGDMPDVKRSKLASPITIAKGNISVKMEEDIQVSRDAARLRQVCDAVCAVKHDSQGACANASALVIDFFMHGKSLSLLPPEILDAKMEIVGETDDTTNVTMQIEFVGAGEAALGALHSALFLDIVHVREDDADINMICERRIRAACQACSIEHLEQFLGALDGSSCGLVYLPPAKAKKMIQINVAHMIAWV
jgi:hypothetical protein